MSDIKRILKSEVIYDGKIFKVKKDSVEFINNKTGLREKIEHSGAVCVALMNDDNKFYMVKQYRYGVSCDMLEFVAGKKEIGEHSLECAKREVIEETGYSGKDFKFMGTLIPTGAYLSEVIDLYFAKCDKYIGQKFDEDEFLTLELYSLDEIIDMIMNNEISDSKTIAMAFKIREILK